MHSQYIILYVNIVILSYTNNFIKSPRYFIDIVTRLHAINFLSNSICCLIAFEQISYVLTDSSIKYLFYKLDQLPIFFFFISFKYRNVIWLGSSAWNLCDFKQLEIIDQYIYNIYITYVQFLFLFIRKFLFLFI